MAIEKKVTATRWLKMYGVGFEQAVAGFDREKHAAYDYTDSERAWQKGYDAGLAWLNNGHRIPDGKE
jgi:hypothetical protein